MKWEMLLQRNKFIIAPILLNEINMFALKFCLWFAEMEDSNDI